MSEDIHRLETHAGSCHCGAVKFEIGIDWQSDRIIECNCSICHKKGYIHLIVPEERFKLKTDNIHLSKYRFNTHTAVHTFCEVCGIHPFYIPRSHPDSVDVNVRCLEQLEIADLDIEHFDGANWEDNIDEIR